MGTHTSHFLEKPATKLGWWAVGLGIVFTALFLLVTNDLINFPGRLTLGLGFVAGILTLIALIWKQERSWLLWLVLLPGLFAILFSLGEILFPH
jgi:hypothetical protein